jgi:hypothetical protein
MAEKRMSSPCGNFQTLAGLVWWSLPLWRGEKGLKFQKIIFIYLFIYFQLRVPLYLGGFGTNSIILKMLKKLITFF